MGTTLLINSDVVKSVYSALDALSYDLNSTPPQK